MPAYLSPSHILLGLILSGMKKLPSRDSRQQTMNHIAPTELELHIKLVNVYTLKPQYVIGTVRLRNICWKYQELIYFQQYCLP